jgi:hypothetical protein
MGSTLGFVAAMVDGDSRLVLERMVTPTPRLKRQRCPVPQACFLLFIGTAWVKRTRAQPRP